MKTLFGAAAVAALTGSALAAGEFRITEIFTGLQGNDGTVDWFELSNVGNMPISTNGLIYDDDSADPNSGGLIAPHTLMPGEAVVVLIEAGLEGFQQFEEIWNAEARGITVLTTLDGGALSQEGDVVNILMGDGTIVASQGYTASYGLSTLDFSTGVETPSQLGVNGAFLSGPFFNDDIGNPPFFEVQIVGSPGIIPAPGTAALLACGGLAAVRRRRA